MKRLSMESMKMPHIENMFKKLKFALKKYMYRRIEEKKSTDTIEIFLDSVWQIMDYAYDRISLTSLHTIRLNAKRKKVNLISVDNLADKCHNKYVYRLRPNGLFQLESIESIQLSRIFHYNGIFSSIHIY